VAVAGEASVMPPEVEATEKVWRPAGSAEKVLGLPHGAGAAPSNPQAKVALGPVEWNEIDAPALEVNAAGALSMIVSGAGLAAAGDAPRATVTAIATGAASNAPRARRALVRS
jgi:hypothetical protein